MPKSTNITHKHTIYYCFCIFFSLLFVIFISFLRNFSSLETSFSLFELMNLLCTWIDLHAHTKLSVLMHSFLDVHESCDIAITVAVIEKSLLFKMEFMITLYPDYNHIITSENDLIRADRENGKKRNRRNCWRIVRFAMCKWVENRN